MTNEHPLQSVGDDELLRHLAELTSRSRRVEADLLLHIGEVDSRRLYLREACPSMFTYCTERLHLSEAEAFLRITAARAGREHPLLLDMLVDGRLHLSAIARLAPHLTAENRDLVLQRAVHRSKREILELVAELSPRPDARQMIRRLPTHTYDGRPRTRNPVSACAPTPGGLPSVIVTETPAQPGPPRVEDPAREVAGSHPLERRELGLCPDRVAAGRIEPIAPARFCVRFTAGIELRDKLERLRHLMRSSVPDGDLAAIIEEAVTEKIARMEAARFARTERPRKSLAETDTTPVSRHVPAAVRRAVHERDGGQCAYTDAHGRRCTARGGLEYHHRRPYGHGGDHSVGNVGLLCRAHNDRLAEIDYGTGKRQPVAGKAGGSTE